MRRFLLAALVLSALLPVGRARAEETRTAADATEPGRRLDRALDLVLDGSLRHGDDPRTLVLVLDASASLRQAGFADRLEAALERQRGKLGSTQIALVRVGEKEPVALKATSDAAAVAAAVKTALAGAKDVVQNLYAGVREAASLLAGRPGAREVLLASLENGDLEDDLEATVKALARAKARCFVLAQEAYLSDSWFASHTGTPPPRGTQFTGGDAAFHEVPWGWLFQIGQGHEQASSGFAPFGLSRLASATGGRVFLVDPTTSASHSCSGSGSCPFCANDHLPPSSLYQSGRLRAIAPLVGARDEVLAAVGKDRWYRAVFAAWRKASEAGIVRSKPSLEFAPGSVRPARSTSGSWAPLLGNGLAFPSYAARAGALLEACERIRKEFEADVEDLGPDDGSPRGRAIADYTRFMLAVTRANLVHCIGWCQETGPVLVGKRPSDLAPPEAAWWGSEYRFVGVGYSNWALCHGAGPFREMHLPGGAALRDALADLDALMRAHLERWAGTPFAVAARKASLARFSPTVVGKVVPLDERRNRGRTETPPATTPDRPSRSGDGGTTGGGATTGG